MEFGVDVGALFAAEDIRKLCLAATNLEGDLSQGQALSAKVKYGSADFVW